MVLIKIESSPSVSGIDTPVPWAPRSRRPQRRAPRIAVRPATVFKPDDPTLTPEEHFPAQTNLAVENYPRFINRFNSREILLVIDGSCTNNGQHHDPSRLPVGGCSFLFKKGGVPLHPDVASAGLSFVGQNTGTTGTVAFQLERLGPTGQELDPTSNRAKLRAVLGALQFREWGAEGWRRVVILTDLQYIVDGATRYLPIWINRRWRKPRNAGKYANRDLWRELQMTVDSLRVQGCEVSFWLAKPKEAGSHFIADAKDAARAAAREHPGVVHDRFTKLRGVAL